MTLTPESQEPRQNLRNAAREASLAADQARQALAEQSARLKDTLQARAVRLRNDARQFIVGAQHQVRSGQGRALNVVRERPATTAAAVFGVGLLIGLWVANRARLLDRSADRHEALRQGRLRHGSWR